MQLITLPALALFVTSALAADCLGGANSGVTKLRDAYWDARQKMCSNSDCAYQQTCTVQAAKSYQFESTKKDGPRFIRHTINVSLMRKNTGGQKGFKDCWDATEPFGIADQSMSGIEIVGLIGSVVGIVQFIGEVSNALKNAKDLPEAFQEVGDRIALVRDILQNVERHIDGTAGDGTYQAIKAILENCKDKASQLEKIFQAVAPSDKTPRLKRYALAVKSLGKGKRVEVLAKGMIEDTQLLVLEHAAQAATEDQLANLADAVEVLSEMEPSLPEEESISQTHYGSGDNIAGNKYGGNHNDIKEIHGNPIFGNVTNNHVHRKPGKERSLSELCLRSLAFEGMDSRPTEIKTETAGTCQWLLEHKEFKRWKSRDHSLLWIKGKPGSGKSTLLRYACDNITALQKHKTTPLVLSFFFTGRGTELQKSQEGMFRSLLCQMQSELPDALKALEDAFKWRQAAAGEADEAWQWPPGSLCQYLQRSLWVALSSRPVILFIDALDESGEENAKIIADEFNSWVQRASLGHLNPLHICFTCRHYPVLVFRGALEICVETENERDISMFVDRSLSSFTETTGSNVAQYISDNAAGVFLWASLVVDKVLKLERDRIGKETIEAEVRKTPPTLDEFYGELVQRMDLDAAELIDWICFASRPLTLTELRWAITSSRTSHDSEVRSTHLTPCNDAGMLKDIQTLGLGLLEYRPDSGVVQFYHQSVKDFFLEKGIALLRNVTGPASIAESAHHRLLLTCLRYCYKAIENPELPKAQNDIRAMFPFLHYAVTSWTFHATNISDNDEEFFSWPSDAVLKRLLGFTRLLAPSISPAEGTTLLHIISKQGMAMALRGILKLGQCPKSAINASDYYGRTPLSLAAQYGHGTVVKMLLTNRADIEGTSHHIPLALAIEYKKIDIVRILVANGAKVDYDYVAWYTFEPLVKGTAVQLLTLGKGLQGLVSGRHIPSRYSSVMLGLAAYVAVKFAFGRNGGSTIGLFSILGLVMVSWFLGRPVMRAFVIRACMNGASTIGDSTIIGSALVLMCYPAIASTFRALYYVTGVSYISYFSEFSFTTTCFVLSLGIIAAGMFHEDQVGMWRTPLSRAAEIGDGRVVQLLLFHHANPLRTDRSGETPVSRAIEEKREEVLLVLRRYI
ncbi:hypothetical protein FPOA_06511 [Fusarium poae]|uniref:NACHT domain-containing protein n=1 Tax=Fusarium poae TaxID=36050 RepID=A0A1B8AZX9_FUSPO|nr:hypothetical protein FPOA_06511 [Fusarium poae]